MMIRTIEQQLKLQEIITKYTKECNAQWITLDETLQYKNSHYQSSMIGLGVGKRPVKHLSDDNMYSEIELTNYYDKQIQFFILTDDDNIRIYRNKGTGINGSELVEKISF